MKNRLLAWLVHAYTSLGFVCVAGMAVLVLRADDASFREAFALMVVATVIDATDGWLARAARVHEVLPSFDGAMLDNLADFHSYTSMPLFLLWRAGSLPGHLAWLLLLPLLASAYGYAQVHAKTPDGFFLGFPSYWNIVAFYVYVLRMPGWLAAAVIILFSVLTFVPTRYLYASRGGPFALTINTGAVVYTLLLGYVLWGGGHARILALLSLLYPVMYFVLSGVATTRQARTRVGAADV